METILIELPIEVLEKLRNEAEERGLVAEDFASLVIAKALLDLDDSFD